MMRTRKNRCAMALLLALTCTGVLHAANIDGKHLLLQAQQEVSSIEVEARTADAALLKLKLRRIEVFTADAQILLVTGEGRETRLPRPATRYFAVRNDTDDTHGLIAVHADNRIEGMIQHRGQYQRLHLAGDDLRLELLDSKADPGRRFQCGNDSIGDAQYRADVSAPTIKAVVAEPAALLATRTARIAIDSDEEFLTRFGGNATTATNYVGNLIGYISTIYDAQVNTNMQVSFLRLWTPATDPWVQTSAGCLMLETGKYWNDNQAGTSRTLMHFLSGKASLSGIAWIGVLCSGGFSTSPQQIGLTCPPLVTATNANYGGAYGVTSGISGSFNPGSPSPAWDVYAVAHEIGHNFNSPHTHCYAGLNGNASSIDQCHVESGASCYAGATSLPGAGSATGTIMSYCHLRSGGFNNIALTLGNGHAFGIEPQRVPTRMAAHAQSAATSSPSCLALQGGSVNVFKNGLE